MKAKPASSNQIPLEATPSEVYVVRWLRYTFFGASIFVAVVCLYVLSLGPVARYYKTHPPKNKPGVVMITLKAKFVGGDDARRSVTFPRWVHVIYSPAFRLLSFGGGVYSRYLWWWMDQEEKCLANLRQLDLAKRKWASEAQKADRATAWADHIIDYLPKHSMLKCPIGGEYHFKPVGTKPECSYHGDKF